MMKVLFAVCFFTSALSSFAASINFDNTDAVKLVSLIQHKHCTAKGGHGPMARSRSFNCTILVKEVACDEAKSNGKKEFSHCHFIDWKSADRATFFMEPDSEGNQKLGEVLVKYNKKPSVTSINCSMTKVINKIKGISCSFLK